VPRGARRRRDCAARTHALQLERAGQPLLSLVEEGLCVAWRVAALYMCSGVGICVLWAVDCDNGVVRRSGFGVGASSVENRDRRTI